MPATVSVIYEPDYTGTKTGVKEFPDFDAAWDYLTRMKQAHQRAGEFSRTLPRGNGFVAVIDGGWQRVTYFLHTEG